MRVDHLLTFLCHHLIITSYKYRLPCAWTLCLVRRQPGNLWDPSCSLPGTPAGHCGSGDTSSRMDFPATSGSESGMNNRQANHVVDITAAFSPFQQICRERPIVMESSMRDSRKTLKRSPQSSKGKRSPAAKSYLHTV